MDYAAELAAEYDGGNADYLSHSNEEYEQATNDGVHDGMDVEGAEPAEDEALMAVPEGGTKPAEEVEPDEVEQLNTGAIADVAQVAKLSGSKTFKECLSKISHYENLPPSDMSTLDSPEYRLIVQANNYAVEIDNDILLIHKFVRDHYAPRFSELETLIVTGPLDYCKTVLAIGNPASLEDALDMEALEKLAVNSATKMVIKVTSTTNTGRQLSAAEWAAVSKACKMCEDLEKARVKILDYVQSRVQFLAPNLSKIVGTRTATKLLGVAGGLNGLAKVPACNLHLFGAQKRAALGLSTGSYSAQRKGTGFIYASPVVQSIGDEYRMKAQRTVAAKCILAIRMDINQSSKDGQYGEKLLEDIEKKLEKLAEPPPAKIIKALPIPTEGAKKRRGGKRARRAKEVYATSELQKLRNRMEFGTAEAEDGAYDETIGLGMIGQSSGRIRAQAGEIRTKAKMSKMNKNRLASLRTSAGSGTATSGLSSSLAFTPVQGLELVDPGRQKRLNEANDMWFKEGTFSFVPKK